MGLAVKVVLWLCLLPFTCGHCLTDLAEGHGLWDTVGASLGVLPVSDPEALQSEVFERNVTVIAWQAKELESDGAEARSI